MANEKELQEEMGLVLPETALMTPIDKAAADLGIDSIPAPEVLMGAETGTLPTPPLFNQPAVDPTLRVDTEWANATDVLDPFNASTVEQIRNMTGAQYPTDPYTGQPLPEAPAPELASLASPAVIAPEQQIVQQKTGDATTTVVEPTTGTINALQGARQAVTAQDAALQAEAAIVESLAQDKALIDQQRSAVASKYAADSEALSREAERQAAINRDEIARLRQEYASRPWQSYWGSKEVGDKIMLGLAVGLGALGQSQIGGQNLAMAFLQSNIDDHNKAQTERFRMLEAQLSAAQTNNVQSQQAINTQFANLVANRAAAYDQLDKQLAAMSAKTNVAAARNTIEKLRSEAALKSNKELFEMENELSARTTNRADVFSSKTMGGNPLSFVRADGQPMTESQSKEYKMFLNVAPALKDIEAFEDQGLTNTKEYSDFRKALINDSRELGALGGMVNGALVLTRFDSLVDRVAARNPAILGYARATRKIMVDKLRLDSGASIAPTEYGNHIQTYLPADNTIVRTPEGQKMDLDQVRNYRRTFLDAALGASGSASQPWYRETRK